MSKGPLAVEWGNWPVVHPQAGMRSTTRVEIVNAGSHAWGDGIFASYHWLDDRGNAIVWDGIRTALPPLGPGERAEVDLEVRAPIPPGRYRLAFDLAARLDAAFERNARPVPDDRVAAVVQPVVRELHAGRFARVADRTRSPA